MHILAASRGTNAGISSRMQASRGGALAVLELAAQFDDLGKQPPSCADPKGCVSLVVSSNANNSLVRQT